VNDRTGKRILVVEDEPIVAMLLEDVILDLGLTVVGPASRLDEALRLAESESLDAAILDINLDGHRSYAVADALRARGIPYAFATGYGEAGLDATHAGRPVLTKPYRQNDVDQLLTGLLAD
jgi:CheY-like chemotaxis protein